MEIVSLLYFVATLIFLPHFINGVKLWGNTELHTTGNIADWHLHHTPSTKSSTAKSAPKRSFSASSSFTGSFRKSSSFKKLFSGKSFREEPSSEKSIPKASYYADCASAKPSSSSESSSSKPSDSERYPSTSSSSGPSYSKTPPSKQSSFKINNFNNPFFALAPQVESIATDESIKKLARSITQLNSEIQSTFNQKLVVKCVSQAHGLLRKDRVPYMDAVWPLGVLHGLNDYVTAHGYESTLEDAIDYQVYLFLFLTTDLQENIMNDVKKFTLSPTKSPKEKPDPVLMERCARARLFNHHEKILKEKETSVPESTTIEKIIEEYLTGIILKDKTSAMMSELINLVGDINITSWEKFFATEVCVHLATYAPEIRTSLEELIIQNSDFRVQFHMIYASKNIIDFFSPCDNANRARELLYKFERPNAALSDGDIRSIINIMKSNKTGIKNRMMIHKILMAKSYFTPRVLSVLFEEINQQNGIPLEVAEIWERIYTSVETNGTTLVDYEYLILRTVPGLVPGARRRLFARKMLGVERQGHQAYKINTIATGLLSLPWKAHQYSLEMAIQLQRKLDDQFETTWRVDVMLFESYIHLISYHEACAYFMLESLNLKLNFRARIKQFAEQVLQNTGGTSGVAPIVLSKFAQNVKDHIEHLGYAQGEIPEYTLKQWAASFHKAIAH